MKESERKEKMQWAREMWDKLLQFKNYKISKSKKRDRKEYFKEYDLKRREKKKEYSRRYYKRHSIALRGLARVYYWINRDKILAQKKEDYHKKRRVSNEGTP